MNEAPGQRIPAVALILGSFAALFQELLLIRWLSAEVPILAYFKNFPLLAAFVGLGAGALMAERKPKLVSSLWALAILSLAVIHTDKLGLDRLIFPEANIDVWGREFSFASGRATAILAGNLSIIFAVLALCVWSFVGIGQVVGNWFRQGPALRMYSADIAGSLGGVVCFSLMSWLQTGPHVWLIAAVAALAAAIYLFDGARLKYAIPLAVVLLAAGLNLWYVKKSPFLIKWSPYYCIRVAEGRTAPAPAGEVFAYFVDVNRDYHQVMVDMRESRLELFPRDSQWWRAMLVWHAQYNFAYYFKQAPRSVLVAGAGTGNNVAGALRNGAGKVTAVEIDPGIIEAGKQLHPLKPYDSSRVKIVNDDIRSFLRKTDEKFDLIEYGILDSHTALSSLSSLRLDNYVYTVEGIKAAYEHLAPDGLMCLSFHEKERVWLGRRVYRSIQLACGEDALATKFAGTCYFLFGPGLDRGPAEASIRDRRLTVADRFYQMGGVRPSTDNWPFLYSNPKGQPFVYFLALILLVVLSGGFVYAIIRGRGEAGPVKLDWHMFLLGAGFLLVETKALAELSLLFGSTWIVNAFVFSGIFVMVLLSVAVVRSGVWKRLDVAYVCLGAVLIAWFLFPRDTLNELSFGVRAFTGTLLVVLPIFFAGIVFARSFAARVNTPVAFGSNLIGAVVGGAAEAASLAFGIKALTLLALGFYAGSWLVSLRRLSSSD